MLTKTKKRLTHTMSTNNRPTHPSKIIKYELEERGISEKDFINVLESSNKEYLEDMFKGRKPITQEIAKEIGERLNISSISLLNLQTLYNAEKLIKGEF